MSKGLYFRKIDLHVHTPASSCFSDKTVTADEIISTAINKGLDAIAITDHNTGEWIDRIKEAAKDTNLIVFPGVEITVSEGFHIIGLFDLTFGTSEINNLLGSLDITPERFAKTDTACNLGTHKVIDTIIARGGLAILAHIDSIKGAFNELAGINRINLFNEVNYSAVETMAWELPVDFKIENGFKKFPAFYQASDNPDPNNTTKHSKEGIGSRYTYFKLDSICLEGIRQCYSDPFVRVKSMDHVIEDNYPKIVSLKASDGFMRYQNILFHQGLNSIIGGKGVGKSLIIELLRFGLEQPSDIDNISEDHKSKIQNRLGDGNNVEIEIVLQSGTRYKINRVVGGETTCIDIESGVKYEGEIKDLFPILAYSQTEVIKISESEDAQLRLIDSFIDINIFTTRIGNLSRILIDNDNSLSKVYNSIFEMSFVTKGYSTVKTQLIEIDKELKSEVENKDIIEDYNESELHINIVKDKLARFNEVKSLLQEYLDEISNCEFGEIDEALNTDFIKDIENNFNEIVEITIKGILSLIEKTNKKKEGFDKPLTDLEEIHEDKKEKYDVVMSKTKKHQILKLKREGLIGELRELDIKLVEFEKTIERKEELETVRLNLLDDLDHAYDDYYEERVTMYNRLTGESKSKLSLELYHSKNKSEFFNGLTELLRGSHIQSTVIKKICESLMPRRFGDIILSKSIEDLASEADIDINNAEKIISKLWSLENLEPILSLQHHCYPKDVPTIKFRKQDGEYAPLNEISVGQKCTALLIIALFEGDKPVIIDQPEDALDITTIWEDVSDSLRNNKENRQFILTTHNSSIAVSSDSDNFIIVTSNSDIANVKCKGAIDKIEVKNDVIEVLEGGKVPYLLRGTKYNIK